MRMHRRRRRALMKANKHSADFGNPEEVKGMSAISRKRRGRKRRHRRRKRRMTRMKEGTQAADFGNLEEDQGMPSN